MKVARKKLPGIGFFLLFLCLFYFIWTLRATIFYTVDEMIISPVWKNIYSNAIKIVLWILPVVWYLRVKRKIAPCVFLKLTPTFSLRTFLWGSISTIFFCALIFVSSNVKNGHIFYSIPHITPLSAFYVFLSVVVSPFAEEIFFRGFLLGTLMEYTTFWKANIITSTLFLLIHWPNWIWTSGFHASIFSFDIFVLSLFFGFVFYKTKSLYPPILLHILNNFIVAVVK